MANTLKFGNGQWATKVGSTLAYNDEGGNFKPLPFNFTRSGNATRVNSNGLIELVTTNVPRLNYPLIDGVVQGCPSLLLEPQRINLVQYSEDFSNAYWTKAGSSVVSGFVSPKGDLSAFKLVENTNTGGHNIRKNSLPVTLTNTYIFSVIAKKGERDWIMLRDDLHEGVSTTYFDLTNGVVGTTNSAYSKIEALGDGFYRCSTSTVSTHVSSTIYPAIHLAEADNDITYTGDGTSGLYIWGAQLEQGSYATSYIPTQGATATRVVETCIQTPSSGIIGQTEGTLYCEIDFKSKPEAGSPIVGIMTLNNNVTNLQNCIILGIERQSGGTNRFYPFVQVGNSTVAYITGGTLTDGVYKAAFAYKQNDFVLYVNGVQIGTDSSGAVPTTSQVLVGERFNNDAVKIADGIKDTKLYDTRLSNAELATLTSL